MSSERERLGGKERKPEPKHSEERIEDLEVAEDTATEVKGGDGIGFNYGQPQVTYTKQN